METILSIRVPADLRKALQKLADADRRKLSDYIRLQLELLVDSKKSKK
jgi:predicted transcriptional regulator